jgi:hypothetical protein
MQILVNCGCGLDLHQATMVACWVRKQRLVVLLR